MKFSIYLIIIAFTFCSPLSFAQNRSGITHIQDTSYTNLSSLRSISKNYPNAYIREADKDLSIKSWYNEIYSKQGKLKLTIDAFAPSHPKSNLNPAIIFIHGGGWRTGNKSQHQALAKMLAARGYIVFTPAYRLSTEALYPAAVIDVKNSIKWVKKNCKKWKIDTTKIAIAGFSAGGQLAALTGVTPDDPIYQDKLNWKKISSRVQAIIDIDGILAFIHPESGEGDDRKSTSAATYFFGYSKSENPTLWNEGSALYHVTADDPPILFLNSSVERMHAGRTDFIEKYSNLGIYADYYTFNDAPHVFPLMFPWFDDTLDRMDKFLQKIFKR